MMAAATDRNVVFLPLLITTIAGLACYGLFYRRGLWLSVIAYGVSPAERVMLGEVPYRDFLFNYTPGILWLNAALMKVFGARLLVINTGLLVFKLSGLLCLFWAARKLVGGWLALVPVALTLAWLGHRHVFNVHPAQYYLPFALLGLILLLKYDQDGKRRWLVQSGLATGLVFVFKHNVGVLLLACATAAILLRDTLLDDANSRRRISFGLKGVATCWAGFALVAGLLAAVLQEQGALGPMVSHFLHHAAEYSEERAVGLPPLKSVVPAAATLFAAAVPGVILLRRLPRLFLFYVTFAVIAIAAAILIPERFVFLKDSATAAIAYVPMALFASAGAIALRRQRTNTESKRWRSRLLIVALFSAGVYLEVYPRADYYHLVRVLPPVFLLMVVLSDRVTDSVKAYLRGHTGIHLSGPALCVACPFILLAAIGIKDTWLPQFEGLRFADNTELTIERGRGLKAGKREAQFANGLTAMIEANSSPDDLIYSFARRGGAMYFLANRRNPTKLLWWDSVGVAPEEREAVISIVAARRPRLVIIQDALTDARVRRVVDENYTTVGEVLDLAVFERNR